MKKIINGGIYEVDLRGTNNAEFSGQHPSLIIQSIKNEDMYYVIPFTTYTKERWEKYKKRNCCKINSTNSIVRIDKMQLRHINNMNKDNRPPKRWMVGNLLLILTPDELEVVYAKILKYLELSLQKSLKEYKKYYSNYEIFKEKLEDLFLNFNFSENNTFDIEFEESNFTCKCSLSEVSKIGFDDIKVLIKNIFGKKNCDITFDKGKNILLIKVKLNNEKSLTFKENYDKMNVTEG
ncbi:hypothetical protein KB552_15545 (plasmid) [Clostridium perfringens]|uniref:hypothetical protein n=2 Tax=Clostridium perfringens TaxID=1502 RepID=UPI0013E37F30|nr:hypothetical protein [Clostridium perfringens]MDK0660199.1 hypothetical protein [Clostridium perfringens]NGT58949.1 hypothetical protein [Clostridium perfringens]QUD74619.1 hypothetical protein KB552_15545 [Clostridium perfringens]